ncbi:hypothetical protein HNP86_001590 [Methanococcus maripaludis]|uniref:Uncharacterized protein n=1 Tax=Methanococcus maripaludis TaxID=39152 RepID=A0A7J9NVU1_METMI|nr:hypothetical protein [Methanococcus maripaludis]MBA2851437.1 hypothetical protein [Methanococcus maripaludis]
MKLMNEELVNWFMLALFLISGNGLILLGLFGSSSLELILKNIIYLVDCFVLFSSTIYLTWGTLETIGLKVPAKLKKE